MSKSFPFGSVAISIKLPVNEIVAFALRVLVKLRVPLYEVLEP